MEVMRGPFGFVDLDFLRRLNLRVKSRVKANIVEENSIVGELRNQ